MAVTAALFATAGNVVRVQEQPANKDPYHHNFSKDKLKENTDRHLKSITVTTNYGGHYVFNNLNQPQINLDISADATKHIKVMPQAKVSFDIDWQGGWMHSYLYLDLNQNQQFDVTKIEDEELLLCTYYNPDPSTPEEGREKSAGILQQSNTWPYNSL